MQITFTLNHKKVTAEIAADTVLLDLVRSLGCKSVCLLYTSDAADEL